MIDWQVIGTAIGGLVVGIGSFLAGRGGRKAAETATAAEIGVIEMLRDEVQRLSGRLARLEDSERRSRERIFQLEQAMRDAGMTPPPLILSDGPQT